MAEWIVIAVIVLVIFGAGRLPQIGDALGRGIRNFRKAASGQDEIDVTPKKEAPKVSEKSANDPTQRP